MTDTFRPGVNGLHYRAGPNKLYRYDERSIHVLRGWPAPQAWRKTRARPSWRGCRPRWFNLAPVDLDEATRQPWWYVEPGGATEARRCPRCARWFDATYDLAMCHTCTWQVEWRRDRALDAFHRGIPTAVRDAIAPYAERHWHLLALCARVPGAVELAAAGAGRAAGLTAALASCWVFHAVCDPLRAARRLVRRRRREIAEWLGFPAGRLAVRVLERLPPEVATVERLLYLRAALHDDVLARRLAHQQSLTWGTLRVLCDPHVAAMFTPGAVAEVAADHEHGDATVRLALATRAIERRLRGEPRAHRFATLAQVHAAHEDALDWEAHHDDHAGPPSVCPPLPGTAEIVPLRTHDDLVIEGRVMRHCAGSYWHEVVQHRCYVYRVLAPERATLRLALSAGGPLVDELVARANGPVAPATRVAVRDWMRGRSTQRQGWLEWAD